MTKELIVKNYSLNKIEEVKQMATLLKGHIEKNNLSVNIAGKSYAMVEAWQFAGGLMGLYPRIVKVENLSAGKWLSQAEIIDKNGKVVSVGYALCSKDEMKKKSFDEYAILSMAQTRSLGKAYRNLIGWVMKMSGMEGTPAEEAPKDLSKEIMAKAQKSNATNYLEQLKAEATKLGAKTEKEALKIINEKTGLKLTDLKLTEKHSAIVLEKFLTAK